MAEVVSDPLAVAAVDYRDPLAPARFTDSLRRTGFGVLVNHPIPQELLESIYAEWLAFFGTEAKHSYSFDDNHYDGYFAKEAAETAKGHRQRDLKEYFHIYPWGRYPGEVSDKARRYFEIASKLAQELLGWIEANTPPEVKTRFSIPLAEMISGSSLTLLRILRYPPLTGDEPPNALRSAPHEDINLLTVLPASNEPGLQLLSSAGSWNDVPCDFGALAVNVGDMLQEASGGYYRSTSHRVINPTGEAAHRSRISMPLFLHPRPDVVLSDRYTAETYRDERLRILRADRSKGKSGSGY